VLVVIQAHTGPAYISTEVGARAVVISAEARLCHAKRNMTSFPVMVEATSLAGDVVLILVVMNAYGVAIDAATHNDVATDRVVVHA
jgi:hypothetical protein